MSSDEETSGKPFQELERQLRSILGADEKNLVGGSSIDAAVKALGQFARTVGVEVGNAAIMLKEFIQELTNVKGVNASFKKFGLLDVQIATLKPASLPINRDVPPVGKIESIRLGECIRFQMGLGDGNRDVVMNIEEGMSVDLYLGALLGRQTVPVAGSARLARDEGGRLVIIATTMAPGVNLPVSVTIPVKQFISVLKREMFTSN